MHRKIMIQGTGSSVGKSFIVAGLCRVFSQDGYSVAPFKSQNMALNSYVDINGKEMGRAQVVQAECANTIPQYFMNPILLKPNSDNNSQVIIEGKPYADFQAKDYYENIDFFRKIAKNNYQYLSNNYQIGVLEGAGSPAEINFRKTDCVNMGMAELVDAPVILVANIEVGGVFASLYGTLALLDEKDRKRIKGIIINKFRGDISLLQEGIDMFKEKLQKSEYEIDIVGVLPYVEIKIDDEDSLFVDSKKIMTLDDNILKIGIIKCDRMSNFSDFNILQEYSNIDVRYIDTIKEDDKFDIIILPGTKNTFSALEKIKQNNLDKKIKKLYDEGCYIVGICGGFQMLGRYIQEGEKYQEGLSFLDMNTYFYQDKITKQIVNKISSSFEKKRYQNIEIRGYEIHCGISECKEINSLENDENFLVLRDDIMGTYIHGIFDNYEFTNYFLEEIAQRKNKKIPVLDMCCRDFKIKEYDRLADLIRNNLNMELIYSYLK